MPSFPMLLAAVMSSAHLASRLRGDLEHRILAANARKSEVPLLLFGRLGTLEKQRPPGGRNLARVDRPKFGRAATILAVGTGLAAAVPWSINLWKDQFSGKDRWQPPAEGTNHVSNAFAAKAAKAAKAELALAREALIEAWEAPGPWTASEAYRAEEALDIVEAAIDKTQAAWNVAAMHKQEAAADAALNAVEAAMDNSKAAMDEAQACFDTLLRSCADSGALRLEANRFQAEISLATAALKNARKRWFSDWFSDNLPTEADIAAAGSQRREAMRKQLATEEEGLRTRQGLRGKWQRVLNRLRHGKTKLDSHVAIERPASPASTAADPGIQLAAVSDAFAAKEAKAELDLAKTALYKAWAGSGAGKGLLLKAQEALNAAKAAIDNAQAAMARHRRGVDNAEAAWNAAGLEMHNTQAGLEHAYTRVRDTQAAVAEAALKAVDAAMAHSQEAMDEAQRTMDALLGARAESETAAGQAEVHHFEAAIFAAARALEKARNHWFSEATEAEIAAATEAMNLVTSLE